MSSFFKIKKGKQTYIYIYIYITLAVEQASCGGTILYNMPCVSFPFDIIYQSPNLIRMSCKTYVLHHLIKDCYIIMLLKIQYILPYLITPQYSINSQFDWIYIWVLELIWCDYAYFYQPIKKYPNILHELKLGLHNYFLPHYKNWATI